MRTRRNGCSSGCAAGATAAHPLSVRRYRRVSATRELASLAGTMRRRGMGEAEIAASLAVVNRKRCSPPLGDDEVERIAASVARYEPPTRAPRVSSSNGAGAAGPPAPLRNPDPGRARPVQWAWERRLALGKVNLLVGNEGTGKGVVAAWLAAQLSNGALDGDLRGTPVDVLVVGDEDALEDTWTPRLYAVQANWRRIWWPPEDTELDVTTEQGMAVLTDWTQRHHARVVIFDALLDHLGVTDAYNAKEVRNALRPLRRWAAEHDVAVLGSLHPRPMRRRIPYPRRAHHPVAGYRRRAPSGLVPIASVAEHHLRQLIDAGPVELRAAAVAISSRCPKSAESTVTSPPMTICPARLLGGMKARGRAKAMNLTMVCVGRA